MLKEKHASMNAPNNSNLLPRHILLIGMTLILLAASALAYSVGVVYFSITNQISPVNTHNTSKTEFPSLTNTPQRGPTISTFQNPYFPYNGSLALNDPLKNNSMGYQWDTGTIANGSAYCKFFGGSYHVQTEKTFYACNAENIAFRNLAFQVQMTILRGDRGGIFFRQQAHLGPYYYFSIKIDGSYEFDVSNGNNESGINMKMLKKGTSLAIQRGLNQSNLVAIVAIGDSIKLFINLQTIDNLIDTTTTNGLIGVVADATDQPVEVAFSNAKVWSL